MKKICKIVVVLLIVLTLYSVTFNVQAWNLWAQGKKFLNIGSQATGTFDSQNAKVEFEQIIDFLWGIGILVIFVSTVVLGIKYMLVNPDERSRIKQATTPYIIGVVVIFGAVTIWKLVIDVLEGSMM